MTTEHTQNWWTPLVKKGVQSAVSGLVTGLSSGIAARTYKGVSGGAAFQNAGSQLGNIHENMYGNPDRQFNSQWSLNQQQNDHETHLQWMRDATQLEMQKMQMKHDAIMSSVSKGHQGVKEVIDFFRGKEKSQFWKEYQRIMQGQ
ncbi:MAG: hypothetical protein KUF72_17985 [Candidatus Thiodiazotropha sp. (ex Ctena orbiculata)]|nr:hypothetical protein [Candidatus Thiodiazotropha taylori]